MKIMNNTCKEGNCIEKQRVKDVVENLIKDVEPVITPQGTNLHSAGINIACQVINERLDLGIDMKKYPNEFLANSNELIYKQRVKDAIEKFFPYREADLFMMGKQPFESFLLELGLGDDEDETNRT